MHPPGGLIAGGLQVSLMVHPDKCSHVRAKEAFEVLSSANSDLQSDERRREVIHVLNMAKGEEPICRTTASPDDDCSLSSGTELPCRLCTWHTPVHITLRKSDA